MRSVVYGTICPSVLINFTWTGNSTNNQPGKKDFQQKRNIFSVFFDVIHAYDKKYTRLDCEEDMKKKILKHVKTQAKKVWAFWCESIIIWDEMLNNSNNHFVYFFFSEPNNLDHTSAPTTSDHPMPNNIALQPVHTQTLPHPSHQSQPQSYYHMQGHAPSLAPPTQPQYAHPQYYHNNFSTSFWHTMYTCKNFTDKIDSICSELRS